MNTSSEFRPSGARILPFWLSTKSAVIEFRCRGTPWGRKIATNNFGIREMSAKVREQLLAPDYKSRRFLRHFASRAILYDFFIASGQDRARRFMGAVAFIRGHETDAVITMPAFVPKLVCTPYHFDIKRNRQGYWIARDRGGLAGGTFLTRKDAEHFALFETGGDNAHVHTYPEAKAARIDGARAHQRS